MVSPLKTWKYKEPNHFWPVLGGLAVLLHVGILGLSLPYIIEMMQASGGGSAYSTEPIELVVDPAKPAAEGFDTPGELPLSSTPAQSATTRNSTPNNEENDAVVPGTTSNSATDVLRQPETQTMRQTVSQFKTSNRLNNEAPLPSNEAPLPSNEAPLPSNEAPVPSNEVTQSSVASSNSPDGPSGPQSLNPTPLPSNEVTQPSVASSNSPDSSDGPQVINPNNPLSSPDEVISTQVMRATSLSISNPTQKPDDATDKTHTPPRFISETERDAIELSVERLGQLSCGQVDFNQPAAIYKLWISETGSVLAATLWTNGLDVGWKREGDAIACLIENAGFAFDPGTIDGAPAMSDDLLVTVQVQEFTGQ